jgi:tetratricopeptide (TPR) repeat protein
VDLLLQAVDAAGPWRWRWLLTDTDTGEPLADHEVDLDPASDEVAAFGDLYGYARSHAAPDRRTISETGIVERAGAWAGQALLGESVGAAIAAAAPVTVRVSAQAPTDFVLWWPLELAHADGAPLAARGDVTLVYDIAPVQPGSGQAAAAGPLRVLAVFSQPTRTSVLALRRERYALSRLIRRIARQRRMVELQVVQYGVTRERLASIVDSGGGWDVLHLSGHGGLGVFLLEHADGSPDPVDTAGLMKLLRPARRRVRLAVVSACQSAADVTAETLRLIGLADQAKRVEEDAGENGPAGTAGPEPGPEMSAVTGLARALARELDCAVVGMRYPVIDDFAIAFAGDFYERLLSRAQPVDVAAARALAAAAGVAPSAARPAMSVATPGVFGVRAAGLTLTAPRGAPRLDPAEAAMAYFPDEPERFVGRAAAMARASKALAPDIKALAPDSGRTAVLLHGMAGAGKTACALELAYRHQDAFAAVAFWQAPTKDDEFAGALANLAIALETQLRDYGFAMTGHIGTVAALEAFLPRLRQVLEDSGILLVLDNLETLLTPEGTWRDPRWALLIGALTGHGGESRLVLTSRVPPADLGPEVLILPVHALSLSEAIALARELPNLRGLLHADAGAVRAGAEAEAEAVATRDRERVRRVMHVVQGHPELLELADAAAADTARLDAQLDAAESAAAGQGLDAFFRDGTSILDPDQFLAALSGWTSTALEALPPAARLMAEFLACLEDDDRQSEIIEANWADLWRRLDRPGEAPEPGPLLEALAIAALVHSEELPAADDRPPALMYGMHPGVAAAIGAAAPVGVSEAADIELAAFWEAIVGQAQEQEGGEDSVLIVHAGLAAAPYLLRRGDWDSASGLLEYAISRDESPSVIAAALPALRRIAAATSTPKDDAVLARALRAVDPTAAERLLREALDRAAVGGNDRLASGIAGDLINLMRDAGRLGQALEMVGRKAELTRRAGLGPWTQLLDQGRRLQILSLMGEHEQVLADTAVLRDQMSQLPARPGNDDPVSPWNVRELILDTGHTSALALGQWQQCLDLNSEIAASQRQRGAGKYEITRTRFNDAGPLIELGRLEEAGRLLRECQQVFEDHRDTAMLAMALGVRASLEDQLGHRKAAVDFGRTGLRLSYARPDPLNIAIGHGNLANYLGAGGDRAGQRAHRLAAALIRWLTGLTYALANTQRALAAEMRQDGAAKPLPATVAEVVRVAEETDGVRLGDLLAVLQPDAQAVEDALAEILRAAAALPPDEDDGISGQLEQWEPVIDAVAAGCGGDQDAAAELGPLLDDMAEDQDWAALAGVLRRILGGERGEELVDGLDPVDTAIVREVLGRIGRDGQGGAGNPGRSG